MRNGIRTDLACERKGCEQGERYTLHGCSVSKSRERAGGEEVEYACVYLPPEATILGDCSPVRAVATLLEEAAARIAPRAGCVLVACLGNERITPDSLGPCTARALQVTRHVQLLDPAAFSLFGRGSLCMVVPGVLGETGVEAAELVRGAAREVGAELVIAVDALAAGNPAHLGRVVQICERGLRPGSGVGNRRVPVDEARVGCPVLSIGVPTVIDSGTLLCDVLHRAGICGVGEALEQHLLRVGRFLVAPADIDLTVTRCGTLLARAIGSCFGPGEA